MVIRFYGPRQGLSLGVPHRLCRCGRIGCSWDTFLYGDATGDDTPRIVLLHAIVEFKSFGLVGMAFRRLALGISGAVTTCCGASSSRIAPKLPAYGRRMYPNLLGYFFLAPSSLRDGLNLIPLFKTELGVVFSYAMHRLYRSYKRHKRSSEAFLPFVFINCTY